MILLSICTGCTWQIIPMLLGAWLLGWLFWYLYHKAAYQARINDLEKDLNLWHTKATGLEADLSATRYELEKSTASLATLKGKFGDLELRLRACEEQKSE